MCVCVCVCVHLRLAHTNPSLFNLSLSHTHTHTQGYDAPVGSLEEKLLRRSISKTPELLKSFGLDSPAHTRRCGSIVVAWTAEELDKLPHVLERNHAAGDSSARLLSAEELHELEPALSTNSLGAVLCPLETVIDPYLFAMGYAESGRLHGVTTLLSTEVVGVVRSELEGTWKLQLCACDASQSGRSEPSELLVHPPKAEEDELGAMVMDERKNVLGAIRAKAVINCAGLYGDKIECMKTPRESSFSIIPRKGQFLVFRAPPGLAIPSYIVEPIPNSFTKGVIVWTDIYGHVLVGPTATEQASREDRSTDLDTIEELHAYALRVCPALKEATIIGSYSGLRPATKEFRDYFIQAQPQEQWISVGGIRSTGVSASAAIGEYVAELHDALAHAAGGSTGSSRVEHAADTVLPISEAASQQVPVASSIIRNPEVPPLGELAREYQARGDGRVTLFGIDRKVTHPIASFALQDFELQ